jgi:outer membrane immunogenic protein
MKKILLIAAVGFLAFGTVAANAADMAPMVAKAPPPPAPVYDPWTGIYIGGNFGGGLANTDFSGTTNGTLKAKPFQETFNGSRSQHGWLGGGQIGINYEIMPRLVVGVEDDIDWSNIKGSVSACSSKTAAGVIDCATGAGKIDDFGTVRGRVGYLFDNLLVFGSGGFAWAHETATVTETCNGTKCPKTSGVLAINGASYSATPDGWASTQRSEHAGVLVDHRAVFGVVSLKAKPWRGRRNSCGYVHLASPAKCAHSPARGKPSAGE